MKCPRNFMGQPECFIVDHPDRPDLESFCATCQQRFRKDNGGGIALLISTVITTILIVLL